MENKTRINIPTINADDVIEKAALARVKDLDTLINNLIDNMSKASSGKNLTKYWKTQEALIEDVVQSCKNFNKVSNATNASNLLKATNALKAVHGIDLSDIIPDFGNFEKSLQSARNMIGNLDSAFDVSSFKNAFEVFENLKRQGLDVREIFHNLEAGSGAAQLFDDLNNANNTINKLTIKIKELQDKLDDSESGNGIKAIREECEDLRSEIMSIRQEAENTFSAFLTSNNIDADYYKYDEFFDKIRDGSLTAQEAIAEFKRDYAYLLDGNASFDTTQLQDFSKRLDGVSTKITEVSNKLDDITLKGVKVNDGDASGSLEELANVVREIENTTESTNTSAIYESLSKILTIIKEIGQVDTDNLYHLSQTIRQLSKLDDLKINKSSLDNLADCIERICKIDKSSVLSNLSLVDFKNFNDLHISKASLNNLAEYLPRIANINVEKLIELTKVDFSNLNNFKIDKETLNNLKQFANSLGGTLHSNGVNNVNVDKSNISSDNASSTEEAAQAQKDFATANEKAQSSADGSKTPLQLEAELMESIAKNAREAANAKKEFTEANKQVKDSAESSSTSIDEEKRSVDNVGDSADEVKKKLDDVVFKPNTEGFDEIVAKFKLLQSESEQIVKIVKETKRTADGIDVSYKATLKNGSSYYLGESSNPQLLRASEVAYDAKAVEQEAKTFNQAWEEAIKVNNALNETKSILSSLPRTTGLDDEFTSLHTRLLNLNNDLTSGKISVSDYTKEVNSLTSSYSEMFESQQREADNQKLEQQKRIYQELNDTINRYATVSKRIAGKSAYSTDEEEAARLQARIEELRNEPLLSEEQLDKSQKKLDEIETTLEDIQKRVVNTTLDNLQGDIDKYYKNYDKYSIKPKDVDRNPQYTKDLEEYKSTIDKLAAEKERLAGLKLEFITEDDLKNVRQIESDLAEIEKRVKGYSAAEKGSDEQSRLKQIDKINKYLEENTRISQEAKYKLRELLQTLENDGAAANVKKINEEFIRITNNELAAGRAGKSFMDVLKDKKFYSFAGQIASYFSFYDVINVIRRGAQEVRELNKALTEMRKVSDESLSSLKEYQNISFDMGDEVGTTGKQIMESTADWLRLGESMKEASKSASTSNILLNVSEFESIDEATESLVSMSQAYKDLDKIEIVDVLNNLGKLLPKHMVTYGDL